MIVPLLATLTACDLLTPRACTEIGTAVGVTVTVEAPLAARVERAEMRVCWDGACRQPQVVIFPSSGAGPETCEGDSCAVRATPTGERSGMGEVPDLPDKPVTVTLALRDRKGDELAVGRIEVTPERQYPNGRDCGGDGLQAGVIVGRDGELRERP